MANLGLRDTKKWVQYLKEVSNKKCCIFTIVKNERIFLPIWLKYYSKYFTGEDIYIIDHEPDDGSIEECLHKYKFKTIRFCHKTYDNIWKINVANQIQRDLLSNYEYVLYADADEIIVPNPGRYKDLKEYIFKCNKNYVGVTSFEVIHLKEKESPIDLCKPILEQRKYWYRKGVSYDKTLLSKQPLKWTPGFHEAKNIEKYYRDKDLWMIHLHKMDYELCWEKHQNIKRLKHHEECIRQNCSPHYRIANKKVFYQFFYTNCYQETNKKVFSQFFYAIHNQKMLKELKLTPLCLIIIYFLKWTIGKIIGTNNNSWNNYKISKIPLVQKIPKVLLRNKVV